MHNELVLVNEQGQALGTADKLAAHEQGLLHLAFSLMIYRDLQTEHGVLREFLLQKRAACKYHGANLWSNTCCSHPFKDELPAAAVQRRVGEELGIQQTLSLRALEPILYRAEMPNGLIEHEFDHVFISNDALAEFCLNPEEVSETCWLSANELKTAIAETPENYTPWLPLVLDRVLASL